MCVLYGNPCAKRCSNRSSLTGLLSFMLSDEITTGSVSTSDRDKRIYAEKSHAANIANKKFRDMFPDVGDLPNALPFSTDLQRLVLRPYHEGPSQHGRKGAREAC